MKVTPPAVKAKAGTAVLKKKKIDQFQEVMVIHRK